MRRDNWSQIAALAGMVVLVLLVYWPGLGGDFLFDDFANLPALGRYGPVRDWNALLRYLTSGIADPTGRPVSMLSFLLDARNWPADPYPFKRSNLLLHAANGLLLYSVLAALGKQQFADAHTWRRAALLAAALWVVHPLWASTVMYVIQRHAMLATFFVLAGVRAWIASHEAFGRGETRRGYLFAFLAVPVFGLLAGLSKMNGFLLPLLLWTLHVSVLRPPRNLASVQGTAARVALVHLPSAALVLAIGWLGIRASQAPSGRPWSVWERLLSQPRALLDYLDSLFLPGLDATGVFADGFRLSTDWLEPVTTLPAAVVLALLATCAWRVRARWPVLAAAALFFLAGHAVESTAIPLELYFEHRNYLPAVLLFWPVALLLVRPGRHVRWRLGAAAVLVVLLAGITWTQARLWGDPDALARVWAHALPSSPRAQTHAANRELAAGRVDLAIARLTPLAAERPLETQYALTLLDARCLSGQVPADVIGKASAALSAAGIRNDVVNQWLAKTLSPGRNGPCSSLPDQTLQPIADAVASSASARPTMEEQSRLLRLQALVALRRRDCNAALAAFNRRLDVQRRPEFAHEQVGTLAAHCSPRHGLEHLDYYLHLAPRGDAPAASAMLRLRDRVIARQGFWEHEWERLRTVLESEATPPDA